MAHRRRHLSLQLLPPRLPIAIGSAQLVEKVNSALTLALTLVLARTLARTQVLEC